MRTFGNALTAVYGRIRQPVHLLPQFKVKQKLMAALHDSGWGIDPNSGDIAMPTSSISGRSGQDDQSKGADGAAKQAAGADAAGKWPPHLLQATGFRPNDKAAPVRKHRSRFWLHALLIALAGGAGWMTSSIWMQPAGKQRAQVAQASEAQRLAREENSTLTRVLSDLRILQAAYANVQGQVSNLPAKSATDRMNGELASVTKALATLRRQSDAKDKDHAAVVRGLAERMAAEQKSGAAAIAALKARVEQLEKARVDMAPVASVNASRIARSQPPKEPASASSSLKRKPLDYVLRDVYRGSALIETRRGDILEVTPGMHIPGAGRVQSIVRRSGKWMVITSNGVIDSQPY